MYIKSSLFKSIALLLVLCFTGIFALPSLNPQQEAEACLGNFWKNVLTGIGANAGYDIIKQTFMTKEGHKSEVDPNGTHDNDDHDIITLNRNQYKCGQCGTISVTEQGLKTISHKLEYKCGGCNDTVTLDGCNHNVFQFDPDKAKHHARCQTCPETHRMCLATANCSSNTNCGSNTDSGNYDYT